MGNSDSELMASDQNHESYADDAKARRVLEVDSEGNVISKAEVVTEGSQTKQLIQDNASEELLTNILKELKKMNTHLMILTDTVIQNSDVGVQ